MELTTIYPLLGFLVIVVVAVAVVWGLIALGNRNDRRTQEVWQAFASQSGLDYRPKKDGKTLARVHGQLHQRSFEMHEERVRLKGGTEGTEVITRMCLQVKGMPDGLAVYERPAGLADGSALEGLLAGAAEMMGKHMPSAVETGNAAFDEKWVTRGFDAEMTRTWMTLGDRMSVLSELTTEEAIGTHRDGLRWEGTTPGTTEAIQAVVGKLERYAERLEQL